MRRRGQRGFILPLSVLLVVILAISGTSFMHLDFLERRLTMNEVDNHGAFYFATAGIERTRESLKIDLANGVPSWTVVLANPALADPAAVYCDTCLCGPDPSKGCIVPQFQTPANTIVPIVTNGDPVTAPDVPIAGVFDSAPAGQVWYSVRAFNDNAPGEVGTQDLNGILTLRARGNVRGEQKLIQVNAQGVPNVDLINCHCNPDARCPTRIRGNNNQGTCDPTTNPSCIALEGHEPACHSTLPKLDPPLTDPNNIYRNADALEDRGWTLPNRFDCSTIDCSKGQINVDVQNNSFYFIDQPAKQVNVKNIGSKHDVVIFSTGDVDVGSGVDLTNAIVVTLKEARFHGGVDLRALLPFPAVIAGEAVHADNNVEIWGAIFSLGIIRLNPITIHGVLIAAEVQVQGDSTFTDDGNAAYYQFIPGADYGDEDITMKMVTGTWSEID